MTRKPTEAHLRLVESQPEARRPSVSEPIATPGALRLVQGAGDEQADEQTQLDPQRIEFAQWFADWWLRRGRQLVALPEQRRAA